MNYVIGSGPAGVAAAASLLDQGLPVMLLDAGGELEPEIQSVVDRLARLPPEAWSAADRETLKGPLRYNSERTLLKLAFGSDYVYRDVDALQPVVTHGVDAYRSLATGGLSVLWGASVLPYSEADFDGWPFGAADMHRHYVSALEMTGLAAREDALQRIYPLHIQPTAPLYLSRQARFMAARMARHADLLERQGIHAGGARLAIANVPDSSQSCVECGLCLYGCPYGLIYSSQLTLRTRLARSPLFTYVPGVVVRRLKEARGTVTIEAISRTTLQPQRFQAARVYLAAGVLPSTAILLDSLQAPATPVSLKQSDHFLLPMALRGFSGRVSGERLQTLSQLFVEILDARIAPRGVHLQLYTYNDHYARMAKDRLGPLHPLLGPVILGLIERIVLFKGYLHSEESAGIRASLEPTTSGPVLRLDAEAPQRSDRTIRAVVALLRKNSRQIGAFPIPFGLRRGLPGSGAHVGGSFPMRRSPGRFESDMLGRPAGFTRVHVVDSTVFPTLPAAPPTLTIMANAFRIASRARQIVEYPECSG